MRVRFLGDAQQWGDGGEFHGWRIASCDPRGGWHNRWRAPDGPHEQALVRACIALDSAAFWAPCGVEATLLDGKLTTVFPPGARVGPLRPRRAEG